MQQIPVYSFTGFLDSGKTKFIQETLEDPRFNDGERTLKELNIKAGDRIIILAGSGVRPGNIARLEASTGCKEFHSSSHGPDGRTSREVVAAMVNYNQ